LHHFLGDFSAPGFNWESGTPLHKCHYYCKLNRGAIYTSTCFLGLRQCTEDVDSPNLLDPFFVNFTDLKSVPADSGLVVPDTYRPPLNTGAFLPHVNYNLNSELVIKFLQQASTFYFTTFCLCMTGQVCMKLLLV
jgi:hypothetical protein